MIQKILVAMDDTPSGATVFAEALSLAQSLKASLVLVHVLSEVEVIMPVGGGYYPALNEELFRIYHSHWEMVKKQSQELLTSLTYEASKKDVKAEYYQRIGSVGDVICELASQVQADLIVVGRRGFTGLTEFLSGSVSNFVMHHAPCSVLIIQCLKDKSQDSEKVSQQQTSVTS